MYVRLYVYINLSIGLNIQGKIKVGHPTYFFAAKIKVVKTFMASNLLFILENKSWGYKTNPKENPKSWGPRQSQNMCDMFIIWGSSLASPAESAATWTVGCMPCTTTLQRLANALTQLEQYGSRCCISGIIIPRNCDNLTIQRLWR